MQLQDYNKLDIGHKACILCEHGVFIEKYLDFDRISSLYFLDNFFIEIVVSVDDNHVIDIIPFRNGGRLDKYLRGVSLRELL